VVGRPDDLSLRVAVGVDDVLGLDELRLLVRRHCRQDPQEVRRRRLLELVDVRLLDEVEGPLRRRRRLLADPVPLITEDLDPFLNAALAASPDGYKLVVLDTVGRAMQGVNENAQEHASAFTNMVERIQHELGATVLALHHTGHGDGSRARGSSVFGADADTVVRLDRPDKNYTVALTMTKQKDASEWDTPRYAKLNEIHLSPEVVSLVAMKPSKIEMATKDKSVTEQNVAVILDTVEAAMLSVLAGNPAKAWSARKLAEAAAAGGKCGCNSEQVRKKYLPILKDSATRDITRCYDVMTEMWRWSE